MSSLDARVMPFGKYRGERVDTIVADDPGYLRWTLEEVSFSLERFGPGGLDLYNYIREALRRKGELNE